MSASLTNILRLRGVRCKLVGETADPGHGPYFGQADWSTEEETRADADRMVASGHYKVIEIITQTRRNGRWTHHSRAPFFSASVSSVPLW